MVLAALASVGLRGQHLQAASVASIVVCLALWIRAKTVDQAARGNAERRAVFVGLWPPTLWLVGESLDERERSVGDATRSRPGGRERGRVARGWGRRR